jgi:type II secretory pathway pseudopilin PulG
LIDKLKDIGGRSPRVPLENGAILVKNPAILLITGLLLAGCAGGTGGFFGTGARAVTAGQPQTEEQLAAQAAVNAQNAAQTAATTGQRKSTLWDLFRNSDDPNTTVEVNKYLWVAALDVLSFLPIESVDPFTGVIVTGYGTPPGGGRAYRATILVQDPALDARSLKIAMQTKSGPVDPETLRAVEDAILSRARELRIADSNL